MIALAYVVSFVLILLALDTACAPGMPAPAPNPDAAPFTPDIAPAIAPTPQEKALLRSLVNAHAYADALIALGDLSAATAREARLIADCDTDPISRADAAIVADFLSQSTWLNESWRVSA